MDKFGQHLGQWSRYGPTYGHIGQRFPQIDQFGPYVWQVLAEFGRISANLDQHRSDNRQHRPDLAETVPKLVSGSTSGAHLGQLFGNLWAAVELAGIAEGNRPGRPGRAPVPRVSPRCGTNGWGTSHGPLRRTPPRKARWRPPPWWQTCQTHRRPPEGRHGTTNWSRGPDDCLAAIKGLDWPSLAQDRHAWSKSA